MKTVYNLGIDIGSTTIKAVVTDENKTILFRQYQRHLADISLSLHKILEEAARAFPGEVFRVAITGNASIAIAEALGIPFVQEVIASSFAVKEFIPSADVAVELGGEDAKIMYFSGGTEQRMNGICAGGTGAFIDQMASLLGTDAQGLNELAKKAKTVYPIASRCGVFAKSDIQPLLNEGAKKEDLALSIFHAVVNQTVCGLACGRPIRGSVAFLGGPLYFLSELRNCFEQLLHLKPEDVLFPPDSHLFAAMGTAVYAQKTEKEFSLNDLLIAFDAYQPQGNAQERMESLFRDKKEYGEFLARHAKDKVKRGEILTYEGKCYLGIDAGSTTTKLALIGQDGGLLYTFYENNNGNPLLLTMKALKELYAMLPQKAHIASACVTGYGEKLIKAALRIDSGEVETIAHYKGASFFMPDVDFILDIGGQDIKCMRIKDRAIDNIFLNEACSSGCGSFIDTFAKSLGYSVADFAQCALFAASPVDLGSRCTVFMNSKVKQAQKEGAGVADISAGLAYSVIKNALMKVIKVSDFDELGVHIVVQGGTFHNDAVLRSFEKLIGKDVIRPDIAGLIGAFGAALIARENAEENFSSILNAEEIGALQIKITTTRCKGCSNQCMLTVNKFSGSHHEIFISGNRCERGSQISRGINEEGEKLPNLYEYKYNRFFDYQPLNIDDAPRGTVGLPRSLNMYENYPFWFTFFTSLGYSVLLSEKSSGKTYTDGIESIPSETICYPAKLVHGHILSLIGQGIKFIFYPSVAYENLEFPNSDNCFNCPVVTSYSENIKNNMEILRDENIRFMNPFISLKEYKAAEKRLIQFFEPMGIATPEIKKAAQNAWAEQARARDDLRRKGEETIAFLKKTNGRGIVLAGRPYHIDEQVNHGIPKLITDLGFAVFTEDSIAHKAKNFEKLSVVNQWAYHARLYAAASYVTENPLLEFVQLNSFGCGLDAITADEVQRILHNGGKLYTILKIDEINNLGTARIRLRSLSAAVREREKLKNVLPAEKETFRRRIFTKKMRSAHTILCPQMSPVHFQFIQTAFNSCGYHIEILPEVDTNAINEGLRYVNNDACYPTLIVVGQMISALKSGKYDLNNVSVAITQTGGGCRATNYISLLRKALMRAGFGHIPVISLNASGLENNPGMKYSMGLLHRSMMAIIYGDLFMKVLYKTRPYEAVRGSAEKLYRYWVNKCNLNIVKGSISEFKKNIKQIVTEFDHLELKELSKPLVGIVGEILVKFHPTANNELVGILEQEGAEAVVPDLMGFLLYCAYNTIEKKRYFFTSAKSAFIGGVTIFIMEFYRKTLKKAIEASRRFTPSCSIRTLAKLASEIVSTANQTGEGWLLTAEMIELIHSGVNNILCLQPFACLPNHITGKGVMKEIKRIYPESNIYPLDYDASASAVNQLNRIKLLLAEAQWTAEPRQEELEYT